MPQFDTFSFLSQLFWVFLAFLIFYLLICFYLLPAIAAILKTRKRKLAQISSNLDSALTVNTDFTMLTKASLDTINTKLVSLLDSSNNSGVSTNITKRLNVFSLKSESVRDFHNVVFTQAQITYLLYV
jgi:hypothetical protein